MRMNKLIKIVAIYLLVGFLVVNLLRVSRHIGSGSDLYLLARSVIITDITDAVFWILVLIWPIYLLIFFYYWVAGNYV